VSERNPARNQRAGADFGGGASRELLTSPRATPSSSPAPIAISVSRIVVHRPDRKSGP
jgi:hypothetical protein